MGDGDCIQLYNVLFNRIMDTLKMVHMSKNYYDPTVLEGVIFYDLDSMIPSPPQWQAYKLKKIKKYWASKVFTSFVLFLRVLFFLGFGAHDIPPGPPLLLGHAL